MPGPRRNAQKQDYVPLASFRYALRKFLAFSKEFLSKTANLTPEQYEALLALEAFGRRKGLLVGELSERLQVKHHTAVALTNKLSARGLITKQRNHEDARHVQVRMSPAGRKLLGPVARRHREKIGELSAEMLAALRELGPLN